MYILDYVFLYEEDEGSIGRNIVRSQADFFLMSKHNI